MLNNMSDGGRNKLPAFIINSGGATIARPTIASLEDADKFVSERIGTDGTFSCYLGEEILINDGAYNDVWQVVGVDTELGKGDTSLTKHHITLVPKTIIDVSKIHSSNDNCNGYVNSDIMYAKTIPNIVTHLEKVLGDHLLERRVKLSNATSDSTSPNAYMSSDNGYYSVKANLLCQMQIFGTLGSYGNEYDTGDDTEQLPGFKYGEVDKGIYDWYWLRDIYGYCDPYQSYRFSAVCSDGHILNCNVDHSSLGVRPLITIG